MGLLALIRPLMKKGWPICRLITADRIISFILKETMASPFDSVMGSSSFRPLCCPSGFTGSLRCLVCVLASGLASPGEAFTVFYGERNPWCKYKPHSPSTVQATQNGSPNVLCTLNCGHVSGITIHCPGNPGHGSRFVENTAAEKLVTLIFLKL